MKLNKELILNNEEYIKLLSGKSKWKYAIANFMENDFTEENLLMLLTDMYKYEKILEQTIEMYEYYSNKNHEILENHMKCLKEHGVNLNNDK
jgi:hypothetical protein